MVNEYKATEGRTGDMDEDEIRLWMVERSYDSRNLVTLVYATPDGGRYHRKELSSTLLSRTEVTASIDYPADSLEPVSDADLRERYAKEAARMANTHAPDDVL